jgi:phosphopentomutase
MTTVIALRVGSDGNSCEARCTERDANNGVLVEYYLDDQLFRVAEHDGDTPLMEIFRHINKTFDDML